MPGDTQKQPWETRLRDAAAHVEDDVRKLITYINDEVMPDVRRNGSVALHAAAAELERLARQMDHQAAQPADESGRTPPPPTPPRE